MTNNKRNTWANVKQNPGIKLQTDLPPRRKQNWAVKGDQGQKGGYSHEKIVRENNPYHFVADKEHFSKGPRSHPGLSGDEFYNTPKVIGQGRSVQPCMLGMGDRNSTNTRQNSTNPFESNYSPERSIPKRLELESFNDVKTSGSEFTVPDSDEIHILEAECAEQEAIKRRKQQAREELIQKHREKKLELTR